MEQSKHSRVDPTLRLGRTGKKRGIRTTWNTFERESRTYQSEEEVEIRVRLRGENDDVHYLST